MLADDVYALMIQHKPYNRQDLFCLGCIARASRKLAKRNLKSISVSSSQDSRGTTAALRTATQAARPTLRDINLANLAINPGECHSINRRTVMFRS